MKRWLALVLVAVLALAACGQAGAPGEGEQAQQDQQEEAAEETEQPEETQEEEEPEPPPEPPTTLTVIGPWSGAEMEQFTPVLDAAEEQLDLEIEYRIYRAEDLQSVLPVQFEAQQAPGDVIFMWDWWVAENSQHAVELSDVWEPAAGPFIPEATTADGGVYAVPYAMSVKPGFWYKKSFFEAHGLQPPSSWEEFTGLLDSLAGIDGVENPIVTGDGVGWPISDVTEHFLITFGGPELQRDLIAGEADWTGERVRGVFADRLVPLLAADHFSDPVEWTQGVDLWWNEEYGLYFMGNWITGMVDDPDDLGVFTLPGARGVVAVTDHAFVPRYSQHVEDAKALLGYMISKEGMTMRARQGGKLSGRKDVPADVYPPADASLAQAMSEVEATLPDLDDSVGGNWQRVFWDQLKLLWVQPDSLDTVLSTLQQRFEEQQAQE